MQADKLRELRALLAKATPGDFTVGQGINVMAADGYSATSVQSNLFDSSARNEANAALLVAAANALPELLAIAEGAEADRADARRLDALRDNSWDLRCFDTHGGEDIAWEVIEHHGDAPHERRVSVVYADDPRAAIDAAMAGAVTQGES